MTKIDISIVIVNWNAGKLLLNCLKSIIQYTAEVNYEIIVIDNNSRKDTLNCLDDLSDNEKVKIVYLPENIGFSKANNLGVEISRGKYILFLNPDTLVFDNSILQLYKSYLQISRTKRIGILVPELLNVDGTIQTSPQSFPIISIKRLSIFIKKRFFYKHNVPMIRETEWARGACFFIPRTLGNSYGFWNEEFSLYGEDIELCYRFKKYKLKTYIDSNIKIFHYYNQSGKQIFSDYQSMYKKEKGLELFYKMYKSKFSFILFELCMLLKGGLTYYKYQDVNRMRVSVEYIKKTLFK